jgi:anti-sigma B factor antagonist
MASPGLALLVKLHRRCTEHDLTLAVVATGHVVLRPLELSGLDQVFALHPTVDEAIGGHVDGCWCDKHHRPR